MRTLLSAAIIVTATIALNQTVSAVAWDWTYDANALPTASGSIEVGGVPTSAFQTIYGGAVSESVSGGIYSASTMVVDGAGALGLSKLTDSASEAYLQSTTGYTVEFRFRMNDIDVEEADAGVGAFGFTVEDGDTAVNSWWNLGVGRTGSQYSVLLRGGNSLNGVRVNIDNTDFHTYRVTQLGNTVTLYVDNNPVAAGSINDPRIDIAENALVWGDATGAGDSAFDVDYIYAYAGGAVAPVPEPTMLGLLGLAGVVLMRRRTPQA